jgi:hypothetical protein
MQIAFSEAEICITKQISMQTIVQQTEMMYRDEQVRLGAVSKFLTWSQNQEKNRFGWLALILASHGCVLTPLTLFAVILSGASLPLFIAAIIAMGLALVTNLAAMPTKVIIPAFFLSILIDVTIVVICAVNGFDPAAVGV